MDAQLFHHHAHHGGNRGYKLHDGRGNACVHIPRGGGNEPRLSLQLRTKREI